MINSNKIIGHNDTFNNLLNLYKLNKLPNKILLAGQKGIGKSLFVELFLNLVYSIDDKKNNISKLIENNLHPNIFKIFRKKDKKNIDISQIREMIQFQNHSSFNNKIRFIIIENIEDLNLNSANALLKSIEEPNKNLFFILTYNTGNIIPDTLRSRCIEFKLSLNIIEVKLIVNNYFNENIFDLICKDYINYYNSPSFLISLVLFLKDKNKDLNNFNIESFIYDIIKNKYYIYDSFIKNNLNIFIELFFYKNINRSKKISYKIKHYFYFKLSEIKKYNLDLETFFLEFEDKLLSE